MPLTQRPGDYDEVAERARLADHHARHPKCRPSGSLCSAMCRACLCVESDVTTDEQKGGGSREDCGKTTCTLHPWQPYQPGGRKKRLASAKNLTTLEAARRSKANKSLTPVVVGL